MPYAVSDIVDHLTVLPPFPKVTSKLLVMLEDETVGMEELSSVISTDPSLVAMVLHLANSPFYMVGKPIETVKEAVMVLGMNTIKSITTGASLQRGLMAVRPSTRAFDMLGYWRHSYATAIAASQLARNHDRRLSDTLYVVGLIHDIGKVILAYYWPEVWRAIVKSVEAGEPYEEAELRLFVCSHQELGSRLCAAWQFPEHIIALMRSLLENDYAPPAASSLMLAHRLVLHEGYGFLAPTTGRDDSFELTHELRQIAESLHLDVDYQLRTLES